MTLHILHGAMFLAYPPPRTCGSIRIGYIWRHLGLCSGNSFKNVPQWTVYLHKDYLITLGARSVSMPPHDDMVATFTIGYDIELALSPKEVSRK
jgi:hypothetical protein